MSLFRLENGNSTNQKFNKRVLLIVPLMFICSALAPQARAVCHEGCLPYDNTVLGDYALENNTTGGTNVANGNFALFSNTTGETNTAIGFATLISNMTGDKNTATGCEALNANTTGGNNTATGGRALYSNATGGSNTATGVNALYSNRSGGSNTATGVNALYSNTGSNNTATGVAALFNNTNGSSNTAIGFHALINATGSSNIALGVEAGWKLTTGSNNIDIGNVAVAGEPNTIRIGTQGTQTGTYIAGIHGVTIPRGAPVFVDANGHLGTKISAQRFKDNIKPMDKASEAIHALKPVTFYYNKELDPERTPQFGLLAEDVETVNPDLVARDAEGKPYTVRYEAVNAMLLNEFLKEHRKNEEQQAIIMQLKSTDAKQEAIIAQQQKQIEALTVGLQKVSAQLELSKHAPQTVAENQ